MVSLILLCVLILLSESCISANNSTTCQLNQVALTLNSWNPAINIACELFAGKDESESTFQRSFGVTTIGPVPLVKEPFLLSECSIHIECSMRVLSYEQSASHILKFNQPIKLKEEPPSPSVLSIIWSFVKSFLVVFLELGVTILEALFHPTKSIYDLFYKSTSFSDALVDAGTDELTDYQKELKTKASWDKNFAELSSVINNRNNIKQDVFCDPKKSSDSQRILLHPQVYIDVMCSVPLHQQLRSKFLKASS